MKTLLKNHLDRKASTQRAFFGGILALLCCEMALAELEVVEDQGGVDASRYYEAFQSKPNKTARSEPLGRVTEANMLPVRAERISPGAVARREINAPGLRPFFMVGDDDLSRQWLEERGEALRAMGAVGMVVNVETAAALSQLRSIIPTVTMLPTPGDDVAGRLGLEHYPVLITDKSIEQ